jgi:hypothetical protein
VTGARERSGDAAQERLSDCAFSACADDQHLRAARCCVQPFGGRTRVEADRDISKVEVVAYVGTQRLDPCPRGRWPVRVDDVDELQRQTEAACERTREACRCAWVERSMPRMMVIGMVG